jgi:hypothetical protein
MWSVSLEMDTSDFTESVYAERLCNPLSWFEHARALIATARIAKQQAAVLVNIPEKSELENVCSMLYGLAIENLFKAVWVLNEFGSPHDEGRLPVSEFPSKIKTHDLVKLAAMVDKKTSEQYRDSLSLLSGAAIWAGRYPCSIQGKEGTIFRMSAIHDDAELIYDKFRKYFTISS